MTTDVSIANRALTLCGMKPIVSFTDATANALTIKRMYSETLKSVLSTYLWSFAIKRVVLAELSTTLAFYENNQNYVYAIPSDCLFVGDVSPTYAKYKVENGTIISDTPNLALRYTYLNDDASKYFSAFVDALADRLSAEICYNLTGNATKGESLMQKYESISLPRAKSTDASQGDAQEMLQDYWVDAKDLGA